VYFGEQAATGVEDPHHAVFNQNLEPALVQLPDANDVAVRREM
jgi:hypothetical protein